MKEEIKEILDKLRSDDYYEKEYQKSVYYERDLKKLKDYITNLQEENVRLREIICFNEDYKSRIDKAIEYITMFKDDIRGLDEVVLLNILQGEDTKESEVN